MSVATTHWPRNHVPRPLWSMFERIKDVGHPEEEMLSVYRDHGVVRKESRTDNFNKTAENRNIYQLVHPGWLVVNRMKAWQGSLGISSLRGIVSGHYLCFRPRHDEDPKFVNYLLRSDVYTTELRRLSRGVRPNQLEIDNDLLRTVPVFLPDKESQRRIAAFLDIEMERIDQLIASKALMIERAEERFESAVHRAVTKGTGACETKDSGQAWAGQIPAHWGMAPVGAFFDCQLGKMLNAEAAGGSDQFPYLRNINVQWDRINSDDLATMHFDEQDRLRCSLEPGDVLVCEGGEVGRAAVWAGEVDDCYYQKAIHRLRLLRQGTANPRFLMYCFRAAAKLKVFSVQGNLSTIVHLTGEQLSVQRFPWPSIEEQDAIVSVLDTQRDRTQDLVANLRKQVHLLQERRRSLITSAVTGETEVP